MRTLPINKAVSYLAPSLITTGLFVSITVSAMPLQSTASIISKPDKEAVLSRKTENGSLAKNPVIARNTVAKPGPATTTAQKNQDKKAISRCWKRLMNMVREVSHARHPKSS